MIKPSVQQKESGQLQIHKSSIPVCSCKGNKMISSRDPYIKKRNTSMMNIIEWLFA